MLDDLPSSAKLVMDHGYRRYAWENMARQPIPNGTQGPVCSEIKPRDLV